jgi:selenocysteine-specific elongation factor
MFYVPKLNLNNFYSTNHKEYFCSLNYFNFNLQMEMPERLGKETSCTTLQFTLVDCPGHASLIRTIIGGAQIIDMFILVLDVTKGMQTQTAECLVIGEITCKKMIIVLNKTDLLPQEKRQAMIDKVRFSKIMPVLGFVSGVFK